MQNINKLLQINIAISYYKVIAIICNTVGTIGKDIYAHNKTTQVSTNEYKETRLSRGGMKTIRDTASVINAIQ